MDEFSKELFERLSEVTAFLTDLLDNKGNLAEIEDNLVNNGPNIEDRCQLTLAKAKI